MAGKESAGREPSRGGTSGTAGQASAPWDRTLESWNPAVVFVLAGFGAAIAVLLLLVGSGSTSRSEAFVSSAGFWVWAAVIAAQSAMWAVLTVPVWREVVSLCREAGPSRTIVAVPTLVVAALVLLVTFSPARAIDWPLFGQQVKTSLLTAAAAFGVGVPAIFGICVIQDRVRRHAPKELTANDIAVAVHAREQMRRLLGVAGGIIGLAVLASGALQRATVPAFILETSFPPSAIVLYGAFFTGLLTLTYLPAHLSLRRYCADIGNRYYPLNEVPAPTSDEFSEWVDRRARLNLLTQIDVSASQQLQTSLFILAPLISAVLGALVPKL